MNIKRYLRTSGLISFMIFITVPSSQGINVYKLDFTPINHIYDTAIAQSRKQAIWDVPRFSVQKQSFNESTKTIEWIINDTCEGLTCLSPLLHAAFIDGDGVVLSKTTVSLQGTRPTYRATVTIPSSVWPRITKVVVREGP